MDSHSQLPLGFKALSPDYTRAGFILSETNQNALSIADKWIASQERRLAVCGPDGSGKTHLATIIAKDIGGEAQWKAGDAITDPAPGAHVVIDDVHKATNPEQLLSVVSGCQAAGVRLILAGRGQPVDWAQGLKDLATRLEAMPRLNLGEPDEELLRVVIQKLFVDLQLRVDPTVSAYAAPRLPRTFAAAQAFVAAADAAATEKKSPITKVLAGNVINNLSEGGFRS